MKTVTGILPKTEETTIGNADCCFAANGKEFLSIVEEYVHAIRVRDLINQNNIRPNTMYLYPSGKWNPHVIREINVPFTADVSGCYPELLEHFTVHNDIIMYGDLSQLEIDSSLEPLDVVVLKINDYVVGCYVPTLNSWVAGEWSWHIDYVNVVTRYVFPQFVSALNLEPCPESIAAELRRNNKVPTKISVTLGADPEFEVVRNGWVVRADTNLMLSNPMQSEIGQDGACAQLEFRPKPGKPREVIKNIRTLVKRFAAEYPNYDLTDAGNNYPLGGHIHVGIGKIANVPSGLVSMLDDFVGKPTIEMSGKARETYKSLGAVRVQPHGFEYRSTPSAVFQEPRICYITLKLVENICSKFFNAETMKYNDKPTLNDYMTIGGLTKPQATYFMKFCRNYEHSKSVRASWKVEPAPIREEEALKVRVIFRDDWETSNKVRITTALENGLNIDEPFTITLYGLREERGQCLCTVQLSGLTEYDAIRPTWEGRRHLVIGFSYDIRKYGIPNEVLSELVAKIQTTINED